MNWRDFNDGSEAVMVDAESLNFIWVQFLSIRITSAAATVGWGELSVESAISYR